MPKPDTFDPRLDLFMERVVDVPVARVWRAWTDPDELKRWFTPAPWTTSHCEIDLRPGGRFVTVACPPEGEAFAMTTCYLEIEPERKLVWTDALGPDYRPAAAPNPCVGAFFTATVLFAPEGAGTRYTVIIRHGDPAAKIRHEEQGFPGGWEEALAQLVAMVGAEA